MDLSSRAERQRLILESEAHNARFIATVVAAPSPARSRSESSETDTDSARDADEVGEMLVPSPVKPREDELEAREKTQRKRREREPESLEAMLSLRRS